MEILILFELNVALLFSFPVCLLTASCKDEKPDDFDQLSINNKRLLINDAQAVSDRFLELERKLQELTGKVATLERENTQIAGMMTSSQREIIDMTGKVTSLESENSKLKSTVAMTTETINNLVGTKDFAPSHFPRALYHPDQVARVWGAEYQYSYGNVEIEDDVPCSVCMDSNAITSMMIPGKSSCPSGWKTQYIGHLCENYYANPAASEYACVDDNLEYFDGRRQNDNGKLFYPVKTVCGSLPCPPYQDAKYLACVVCTK